MVRELIQNGGCILSTDDKNSVEANFQGWIERFERQQARQSEQIETLARTASELSADVRSLMKGQDSLFNRSSRPFQWSALVAAVALGATAIGLIIAPMKESDDQQIGFDKRVMQYMLESEYRHGKTDTNVEWLQELENRANRRLHSEIE